MNQYPYGYGQKDGHLPQSSPHPSLPPFHSSSSHPNTDPVLYGEVSREAFDFNRRSIPGLAFVQPVDPPSTPITSQQMWNTSAYRDDLNANTPYGEFTVIQTAEHPSATNPLSSRLVSKANDESREEGELSEGEFEDLYEPRPNDEPKASMLLSVPSRIGNNSSANSGGSTESALYSGVGDAGSGDMILGPHASSHQGRERSGSYSPYLSPREIHGGSEEQRPADAVSSVHETRGAPPNEGRRFVSKAYERHNENQRQQDYAGASQSNARSTAAPMNTGQFPFNSLAEAKKKAQAAILNLWPLEVRLQSYIDEGIDATIVKDLFTELGLDTHTSTSTQTLALELQSQSPTLQERNKVAEKIVANSAGTETQAHSTQAKEPAPPAADPAEERKDRIKRLLAQKAAEAKANAVSSTAAKSPITMTAPATTAAPGNGAPPQSQKNLLLQKKMAALRKSRTERAQLAEPEKNTLDPSTDTYSTRNSSPVPVYGAPVGMAAHTFQPTSSTEDGAGVPGPIPGLALSSLPVEPSPRNHRKRPVASDFVDSPSHAVSKRPFGHSRDNPLIIDVSDGSDDGDVEMEMGSPTEGAMQPAHKSDLSKSTSSFRNYPPLPGGLARHHSSPAPVARTPPTNQRDQKAQDELNKFEKNIADLRRQIAEAEARKRVTAGQLGNKSSTSNSDFSNASSGEGSSVLGNTESISNVLSATAGIASSQKLPKLSEMKQPGLESTAERRMRLSSQAVPAAEANLRSKARRIQQMKEELSYLENEAEEEEAELKRLNDEVERLDVEIAHQRELATAHNRLIAAELDLLVSGDTTTDYAVEPDTTQSEVVTRDASPLQQSEHAELDAETGVSPSADVDADPSRSATGNLNRGVSNNEPVETPAHHDMDHDAGQFPVAAIEASGNINEHEQDSGNDGSISDAYEPSEVHGVSHSCSPFSPAPADEPLPVEVSDTDVQAPAPNSPLPDQISGGGDVGRANSSQIPSREPSPVAEQSQPGFMPYESPLQYFHAYRFHPKFQELVPGGLRSMTYSNKIDANLPMCPTELAGQMCPKGTQCEYQHFESMHVADDQILLQLGGNANYEGEQKQQYINGLRDLLLSFRTQKVKDFQTIAKGIIEYRAKFNGDATKILPLGNLSL